MPPDFRDRYVELGGGDSKVLQEHYRTGRAAILRWIDEIGREELALARSDYLMKTRWPNGSPGPGSRARRYVLGMTLSGRKV
jgi:hypothetical protein